MAIGALGSFMMVVAVMYMPGLSEQLVCIFLFLLGLCYGAQAIVFAVGRELSPKRAAGTAMAFTNMIVMLGGMFLQPLVGLLLDWHLKLRVAAPVLKQQTEQSLTALYNGADYQFALMLLPIGIFMAFILTFALKETHSSVVD